MALDSLSNWMKERDMSLSELSVEAYDRLREALAREPVRSIYKKMTKILARD